jgi:1-acyl-sn-glycerol-3-phosphate acyltransferase
MTVNSLEQVYNINSQLIAYCNININVVGLNKLYKGSKVIVANHSCPFDPIILLNVFKCGFLGSEVIKNIWYLQGILPHLPILIIKRGKTKDTVKRMTKYINKKNDLCVFPEGMTTHPKTLARFRSGSFHTNYPVQPVILQYDPCVADSSYTKLLVKGTTQNSIKVTVKILDPVYPPFDGDKIERVREEMGRSGNLLLSRVSSKDIVDG